MNELNLDLSSLKKNPLNALKFIKVAQFLEKEALKEFKKFVEIEKITFKTETEKKAHTKTYVDAFISGLKNYDVITPKVKELIK